MLGITDLFSECCNLEAMSPDPLFVSDAIHKAVIEASFFHNLLSYLRTELVDLS